MNWVNGRGPTTSPRSIQPAARPTAAKAAVLRIATVNPPTSVRSARRNSLGRWRTRDSPRAATAPNSGPRTIAPMIRICESKTIPMLAIRVAMIMNQPKVHVNSVSS